MKNQNTKSITKTLPSYDEFVDALKDTHDKFVKYAKKCGYDTSDITRAMSNESLLDRYLTWKNK